MEETQSTSTRKHPLAIVLWVVVGACLLYGISQTIIKASALF